MGMLKLQDACLIVDAAEAWRVVRSDRCVMKVGEEVICQGRRVGDVAHHAGKGSIRRQSIGPVELL